MFRGGQPNPYDEIVAKTTDENLTSENWELILNLCDKVQDEGEQGARNVVAAMLKRLMHRMSNVQLYTLTLAESLTKNCGIELHREIASKAFTQGLEKLITDRNTHEKVRRRALSLIAEWSADFESDPSLGIMEECYQNLKSKGHKFDAPSDPAPPDADDALRRMEEEELQLVLEMSMRDKGGRGQWSEYSLAASSGAGGSSSSATHAAPSAAVPHASSSSRQPQTQKPLYGGYVPSSSPAVSAENTSSSLAAAATPAPYVAPVVPVAASPAPSVKSQETPAVVTRVRALHTFEPTVAGELAFEKGDIIKVVDRGYKDWWRGQLKGRTGIFPVNHVEPLPEPTAAELAKEAEQEAAVFNQAANVDRLLQLLRHTDPAKDNFADNEEIQDLYRSCMSLRPKIVKLIDKYSQKRADLVSMNENFVKAQTIFDRLMEDSLARHSAAAYDPSIGYGQPPFRRPDTRGPPEFTQAQAFGWNTQVYDQPAYAGYHTQGAPYPQGPEQPYPPQPYPPQSYVDPAVYQQQPPSQGVHPPQMYGPPVGPIPTPGAYATPGSELQPPPPQSQPPQPYINAAITQQNAAPVHPVMSPAVETTQPQLQAQQPMQSLSQPPNVAPAHVQPQQQPPTPQQQQVHVPAQQQAHVQPQTHVQPQVSPQLEPQTQPPAVQSQPPQQQQQSGPPYVYDPNTTYADPNVQAWAQYYAQGGTDPTGALYFTYVPGVTEPSPSSPGAGNQSEPTVQGGVHGSGYQLRDEGHNPTNSAYAAPSTMRRDSGGQPAASQSPSLQPVNASIPYTSAPYQSGGYATSAPTSSPHEYGNLTNQFAGLNVGGQNAPPAASPGVGAPA